MDIIVMGTLGRTGIDRLLLGSVAGNVIRHSNFHTLSRMFALPVGDEQALRPLLKPYPNDKMEEWQIGEEARDPKNDYPEIINHVKAVGKELCFNYLNKEEHNEHQKQE